MHVPVINLEESPVTPDAESRQPSAVLHHDDISEILQSVMTMAHGMAWNGWMDDRDIIASDEATSSAPILSVRSQNQSCYGERDENGEIR